MRVPQPSLSQLARVFGRIGVLSFGGPAAQISLMHDALVDREAWLSEDEFLRALSFCMLLPGPEAMQLATYAGWRVGGVRGGLIGGLLFVVPGAIVIFALALLYGAYGDLTLVQAAFVGIKATVVVIVLQALWKLGRKALRTPDRWVIAGLSFAAIFALSLPFPAVIAAAAAYGYAAMPRTSTPIEAAPPAGSRLARTLVVWGGLWLAPIAMLWAVGARFLTELALFFATLAVVSFGGAYAVLAYMTQTVVTDKGWIGTAQMIDALGLAETTPGPLILVTQFVGILAGLAQGGTGLGLAAGVLTLWVTFVPCFLWIFAGAPYVEWIGTRPRLAQALSAISAAVVGVILNLSVWFALHVFFASVTDRRFGPMTLAVPDLNSFEPAAGALCGGAATLLLLARWPLPLVLGAVAGAGAGLAMITG